MTHFASYNIEYITFFDRMTCEWGAQISKSISICVMHKIAHPPEHTIFEIKCYKQVMVKEVKSLMQHFNLFQIVARFVGIWSDI